MEMYRALLLISLDHNVVMIAIMVTNLLVRMHVSVKNQELGLVFSLYVSWYNVDHLHRQKTDLSPVQGNG